MGFHAGFRLTNPDVAGSKETTGRELMEQGLPVALKNQPEAAIIIYKRLESAK